MSSGFTFIVCEANIQISCYKTSYLALQTAFVMIDCLVTQFLVTYSLVDTSKIETVMLIANRDLASLSSQQRPTSRV